MMRASWVRTSVGASMRAASSVGRGRSHVGAWPGVSKEGRGASWVRASVRTSVGAASSVRA